MFFFYYYKSNVDLYRKYFINLKNKQTMNKEVIIASALTAVLVAVVLVVRDNMPKSSFSFKKA